MVKGAGAEAADQRGGEDRRDRAASPRFRRRDDRHGDGERDVEADLVEYAAQARLHSGRCLRNAGGRAFVAHSSSVLDNRYAGDSCPVSSWRACSSSASCAGDGSSPPPSRAWPGGAWSGSATGAPFTRQGCGGRPSSSTGAVAVSDGDRSCPEWTYAPEPAGREREHGRLSPEATQQKPPSGDACRRLSDSLCMLDGWPGKNRGLSRAGSCPTGIAY